MLDFGALPPEINSARMYAGPGSGPMMAAALAWNALAAQLELYAAGYSRTLAELHGQSWSGGSSIAMVNAVTPYIAWATATATQAEQAAAQARAAAAAYDAAFAATVPPPAIAANRIQLATLIATNFFGQNTPAIAATEAQYGEMWAQDAAAMYGYAASSAAASTVTPFTRPPQTTNPSESGQSAAIAHTVGVSTGHTQTTLSQLMSVLPERLQTLGLAPSTNAAADPPAAAGATSILTAFQDFDTLVVGPAQPFWQVTYAAFAAGNYGYAVKFDRERHNAASPPKPPLERLVSVRSETFQSGSAGTRGPVFANAGRAASLGGLSIPHSWAAAIPGTNPGAESNSMGTEARAILAGTQNQSAHMPGAVPTSGIGSVTNAGERHTGNAVFRMRDRRFRMPRPAHGG